MRPYVLDERKSSLVYVNGTKDLKQVVGFTYGRCRNLNQPIHRVEPNSDRDFWEAEFAEPPGTVNVKCYPEYSEVLWYTNKSPTGLFDELAQLPEDHPNIWKGEFRVDISDIEWDDEVSGSPDEKLIRDLFEVDQPASEIHDEIPLDEIRDSIEASDSIIRITILEDNFLMLWTKEEEPPHPIIGNDERYSRLQYHIAVSAPLDSERSLPRIETLYLATGEPDISKTDREQLIEDVTEFIKYPRKS